MRQLGDIALHRILELEEPFVAPTEMFAAATAENLEPHRHWLEPKALCPETGKLILPVQSYLVRTRHHTILIDTCIGNDKSADWHKPWHKRSDPTWLENLAAVGVHPKEIDYVLCTHLHLDHTGWNTHLVDGRWMPTFPNARYVFSRREYDHSAEEGGDSFEENVVPVMESGQGVLVDMDFALDDEVWLEPTPGHTPGHVAIRLASKGAAAVMCGDLIHSPVQCAHPDWDFIYDHDPELARRTRRRFLEAQCEGGTLVLTAHFPSPSVGTVMPEGDVFRFHYA